MARPRTFDPADVLQSVMVSFWCKGYGGTTMRGIEAETGVGIRSLANTFGDKDTLFASSLSAYRDMAAGVIAQVFDPPGVDAIAAMFSGMSQPVSDDDPQRYGCLMVNTVFELDDPPKPIADEVRAYREMWRSTFEASLRADGVAEPEARAEFLLASLWGALSQVRLANDTTAAAPIADVVVQTVRSWVPMPE